MNLLHKRFLITGIIVLFCFAASSSVFADQAKIIKMNGEVKVRHGLNEEWDRAVIGMLLRDIDTILTLEAAEVVLRLEGGDTFTLNSNAVVDIGDLRKISERQLFLFLVKNKIKKLKPREGGEYRVKSVSSVRGEDKSSENEIVASETPVWVREKNGARAMCEQDYFPNAIMKFHKIMSNYTAAESCTEIHFFLGKAFEAIDQPGRALDAYQNVLQHSETDVCVSSHSKKIYAAASQAVQALKKRK